MKNRPETPSALVLTRRARLLGVAVAALGLIASPPPRAAAEVFADQVVSYTAGAGVGSYTDPTAALGKPGADAGSGAFTAFNPHFSTSQLARVGAGGELTLRLANFVIVSTAPGVRELGIWENVGFQDTNYPNGQVANPATIFGQDSARVSVSADGVNFIALNGGSPIVFNLPGNYFANATGAFDNAPANPVLADFGKPFTGVLSDFNGENFGAVLGTLNGSAGGTWLDLDATGLSQVGFVRFDGLAAGDTLEVNGVSINNALVGGVVPEPGALGVLGLGLTLMLAAGRVRRVSRARKIALVAICLGLLGGGPARNATAQILTFANIQNWTGTGVNQAALVVDWHDGKTPTSVVWGYRWDGAATGLQMIQAIDAANPRFFLSLTAAFGDPFVFGLGYDLNGNGGTFTAGSPGNETGSASDPADHYAEGVFTKFWGYDLGVGNPYNGGSWTESGVGAGSRQLFDGAWDGYSLSFDEQNFTIPDPGFPTPAAPVPEPATVFLAAWLGCAGLVASRVRAGRRRTPVA